MFLGITTFEIRYQLKNPVFWVGVALFFLIGLGITASENLSIGTPGAVHENAPNAIAVANAVFPLFYLFVITAFVANAIVRDDSSGFAPIVRATPVTSSQIILGRFLGGFIVALLGFVALPVGMWAGTVMPWVDAERIGPQVFSYYAWPFLIFAIPDIFFTSALLFALATRLRSMMAAYIGTVVLVFGYLISTGVVGQKIEYRETLARLDPFGASALGEATRYWTQTDLNTRLVQLSGTLLFNRILAVAIGLVFLAVTVWSFNSSERAPSKWRLRRLARREAREESVAAVAPALGGETVTARDLRPSQWSQFVARLRVEVRQVLTSPGTPILILLGVALTGIVLWFGPSAYGTPDHPTPSAVLVLVRGGFGVSLLLIAAFYGGELVWRERDRNLNEIIDATPVESWVITVPKIFAIFVVLLLVGFAAMLIGIAYELIFGAHDLGLGLYVTWFMIPMAIDLLQIAVLAVFVQVLMPNKYAGWAVLFAWFVAGIFLSNTGYSDPLYRYGGGPSVPLSDFVGQGSFWFGSAVFQFYWMCFAVILVVIAHWLWPRGTDLSLRVRLRKIGSNISAASLAMLAAAVVLMIGTGAYGYYNIKVLNQYRTSDDTEKYQAEYERKYLKFEKLPMPLVTRVTMNVQLFPKQRRLVAVGRYDLQNKTNAPIRDVHVRRGDRTAQFLELAISGARLIYDDPQFGYRIYRFDTPLAPGATAALTWKSQIWHRGFTAGTPPTDIIENGTFVNNFAFTPRIGMDRSGLLTDRAKRRRQHLPDELRPPKLEDMSAVGQNYIHADWVMSDITLSTSADQTPIAPGNEVSDVVANGRHTGRFVSPAPILNFFSIQSARYDVVTRMHNGLKLSVYYNPGHDWNVDKILNALGTSLDYYRAHFGPYQFNYARIIEFPGYASFAQSFAGTMAYSESIGFNGNTNDPTKIDFTTYVVAHEVAHQYWAHQVVGADMQGDTLMSETLAQYSALMVMKHMSAPDNIRRFHP
jgi:ABC-2 type transport system permease protein